MAQQRALIAGGRLGRRGPRHRAPSSRPTPRSRSSSTASPQERARRRAAELGADGRRRARRAGAARRARPRPRPYDAGAPRRARHALDTTGLIDRRGRRPDRRDGAPDERRGPHDRPEGRRRRLPQRRQVLARQPPQRVARGGRPRAPRRHARPQRGRRASGTAARFTLIDTGGMDFARRATRSPARSASRRRPRSPTPTSRCSSSTRSAGVRPGDEELADLLRRWHKPVIVAANKVDDVKDMPLAARVPRARPRRAACRSRAAQGLGTGDLLDRVVERAARGRRRRGGRRRRSAWRSSGARTSASPRSSTGSSAPSGSSSPTSPAPRATRSTCRSRSTAAASCVVDTAGMRRQAKVTESVEYYTDAALAAGGRARRRRARRLRRARRRHRAGPADRRAGDEGGLRDRAGAQQVGPRADGARTTSTTSAPRSTTSCACARKVLTVSAQERAQRRARCSPRRSRSATASRTRIPTPELNRFLGEVVAGAPAARQAGPPAEAALHGADRDAPAALRHPGQHPQPSDARLRLLPREPSARSASASTASR